MLGYYYWGARQAALSQYRVKEEDAAALNVAAPDAPKPPVSDPPSGARQSPLARVLARLAQWFQWAA